MDRIIIEQKDGEISLPTRVIKEPQRLRPLLSEGCWKLFQSICKKPSYPALLSKELGINEQKIYYYIKQLKNSGLIDIDRTEERNGAVAKYYSASSESFSILPTSPSTGKILRKIEQQKNHSGFLSEFVKNGIFTGKIVVGSPDPHGEFKARARDGHLAAEIAAFIGANFPGFESPLVFLDTALPDLKKENSNLLILGGPVSNKFAAQANNFLPIKFEPSGGNWAINSSISKKQYTEDSIGIIEKIPHPYFKGKWIFVIAGKRNTGTISAILALTKKTTQLQKPNSYDLKSEAHVVEGLDMDGDGAIDEVEFRE
ncbi:MAG TPA: hypothetical protein VJG83_04005 [archaeon]|nr:hypothetical protein [archaeon]